MPTNSKFLTKLTRLAKQLERDAESHISRLLNECDNDPAEIAVIEREIDKVAQVKVDANDIIHLCHQLKTSSVPIAELFSTHFIKPFQNLHDNDDLGDFSITVSQFIQDTEGLLANQEQSIENKYESDDDLEDEVKSELSQEQHLAPRRHSLFHQHLFSKANSLLITDNKTKITQLKSETIKYITQSQTQLIELQKGIDNARDNEVRFNKLMRTTILEHALEKAKIILSRCDKLLGLNTIEGVEPLEFFKVDNDLKMGIDNLHSDLKSLTTMIDPVGFFSSTNSTATDLKAYLDKITSIIPGLPKPLDANDKWAAHSPSPSPQYKSPFVILKVQADNFVKELTTQKTQLETEISTISEKAAELLQNKKTKLNMLNIAITAGSEISSMCDNINTHSSTVTELKFEMNKFEDPLHDLSSCVWQINIVLEKEPVSWLTAWTQKSTNPGVAINNFITSIRSTLDRTYKSLPEQFDESIHNEQKGEGARPSAPI